MKLYHTEKEELFIFTKKRLKGDRNNNNIKWMYLWIMLSFIPLAECKANNMTSPIYTSSEINLLDYPVDNDVFLKKNYTHDHTLNTRDKKYLSEAIYGIMQLLSQQKSIQTIAPQLGKNIPFWPKSGPMKRLIFHSGNLLDINIFRENQTTEWDKATLFFNDKNININFTDEDIKNTLELTFINTREGQQLFYSEGQKVYKKFYSYNYQWEKDKRIYVSFDVWPENFNKNNPVPQICRSITLKRHNDIKDKNHYN